MASRGGYLAAVRRAAAQRGMRDLVALLDREPSPEQLQHWLMEQACEDWRGAVRIVPFPRRGCEAYIDAMTGTRGLSRREIRAGAMQYRRWYFRVRQQLEELTGLVAYFYRQGDRERYEFLSSQLNALLDAYEHADIPYLPLDHQSPEAFEGRTDPDWTLIEATWRRLGRLNTAYVRRDAEEHDPWERQPELI